jgi:hypothetical protein
MGAALTLLLRRGSDRSAMPGFDKLRSREAKNPSQDRVTFHDRYLAAATDVTPLAVRVLSPLVPPLEVRVLSPPFPG